MDFKQLEREAIEAELNEICTTYKASDVIDGIVPWILTIIFGASFVSCVLCLGGFSEWLSSFGGTTGINYTFVCLGTTITSFISLCFSIRYKNKKLSRKNKDRIRQALLKEEGSWKIIKTYLQKKLNRTEAEQISSESEFGKLYSKVDTERGGIISLHTRILMRIKQLKESSTPVPEYLTKILESVKDARIKLDKQLIQLAERKQQIQVVIAACQFAIDQIEPALIDLKLLREAGEKVTAVEALEQQVQDFLERDIFPTLGRSLDNLTRETNALREEQFVATIASHTPNLASYFEATERTLADLTTQETKSQKALELIECP